MATWRRSEKLKALKLTNNGDVERDDLCFFERFWVKKNESKRMNMGVHMDGRGGIRLGSGKVEVTGQYLCFSSESQLTLKFQKLFQRHWFAPAPYRRFAGRHLRFADGLLVLSSLYLDAGFYLFVVVTCA
ncbi:hypothetical protein HAX54_018195 [Datura stramonium]|uniref:Uncharacterized protein n=1 Tax=Datura stramonium TaxID=4076 RepID=A0ABS8ULU6_DATST|nr:hypothetical protein [Datura stramonium]